MKIILQGILMMETNELPSETFNLGNAETKCLIPYMGRVFISVWGRKRREKSWVFYSIKYI